MDTDMEKRIGRLERRCSRLKWALVACVMAAVLLTYGLGAVSNTITASRIVIPGDSLTFSTANGQQVLRLYTTGVSDATLTLYTAKAKRGVVMTALDGHGGSVEVHGVDGVEATMGLWGPGTTGLLAVCSRRVDGRKQPALLLTRDENGGVLRAFTNDGQRRATLTIDREGAANLETWQGTNPHVEVEATWPTR